LRADRLLMTDFGLFSAGFVAWLISTLTAGGGSVLMVAMLATLLRGHAIAPVVTVASLIASLVRMNLFWSEIDWRLVRWYLPGATAGAVIGGWVFTRIGGHWIQVCVAVFLISTAWQFRLGNQERSFCMRLPWFLPVSFVSGLTSAIVGAGGLLANPFYLNYGLIKERMLATRAVNSVSVQIVKIASYLVFGALNWDLVRHGLVVGSGAALAIWITRPWLHRLASPYFRRFTVLVMLIAGLGLLWQQRVWLSGLLAAAGQV
jgi:uncharacterized membrane protein YfcA